MATILEHLKAKNNYQTLQRLGCGLTRRIEIAERNGDRRRVERLFRYKAALVSLMKRCPGDGLTERG